MIMILPRLPVSSPGRALRHLGLRGFAGLALSLTVAGCGGSAYLQAWNQREAGDLQAALVSLQGAQASDPGDPDYLRELGAVWFELGQPDSAAVYLEAALSRGAEDARTWFHLGAVSESRDDPSTAIERYRRARSLARTSQGRRLADGRIRVLQRELTIRELRAAVRQEGIMEVSDAGDRAVAVIPFRADELPPERQRLGRGLAVMILSDLSRVEGLRLVERERMDVLLQELKLVDLGEVDARSAPRAGRLVRADAMITGSLSEPTPGRLRVEAAGTRTGTGEILGSGVETQGSLDAFFDLQKEVSLGILEMLGIPVSEGDRQRILNNRPTGSLAAFLAFSAGLEDESRGLYAEAGVAYREAAVLDPGFDVAVEAAEVAEGSAAAGGGAEGPGPVREFIRSVETWERIGDDLVGDILHETLDRTGGSIFPDDPEDLETRFLGIGDPPDNPGGN